MRIFLSLFIPEHSYDLALASLCEKQCSQPHKEASYNRTRGFLPISLGKVGVAGSIKAMPPGTSNRLVHQDMHTQRDRLGLWFWAKMTAFVPKELCLTRSLLTLFRLIWFHLYFVSQWFQEHKFTIGGKMSRLGNVQINGNAISGTQVCN